MLCQVACSVLPVYALLPTSVRFGRIDSSKQAGWKLAAPSRWGANHLCARAGRGGGGWVGWWIPHRRKNLDGTAGKVLRGGRRFPSPQYKVELGGWTSQYCGGKVICERRQFYIHITALPRSYIKCIFP